MRPLNASRGQTQRRDPAPSRMASRWHRLWLTPGFRVLVRVGIPVATLALATGLWLSDAGRRAALVGVYEDLKVQFQNRPEFLVNLIAVEGASPVLAEAIRVGLALELPVSSFALDLQAIRDRVESFDAVARAEIRIQPGGVLLVSVTERLPAFVWRAPEGLFLVDADGYRVAGIGARNLRGDLPLIVGEGAERAAPEALALVRAAKPLVPRLRGLVRMGERRWDLVLDRDQRIMLPEQNAVRALEKLIALDQAETILARDIAVVDLRNDLRTTLRLSPEAAAALREIRLNETGG